MWLVVVGGAMRVGVASVIGAGDRGIGVNHMVFGYLQEMDIVSSKLS